MNYLLGNYGVLISLILGVLIFVTLLAVLLKTAFWWAGRLKTKPNPFVGGAVLLAALGFFFFLSRVPDYLSDGRIRDLYLIDGSRLVVWFTRTDHPAGISTAYSHRIKSYDLTTGERLGRLTLARREPIDDYYIFGPFDHHAWGYSQESGIRFLDLYETESIADEEGIIRRNPELGEAIELRPGTTSECFDPVSFGLYIFAAKGDIFRVDPDLKARAKKDLPLRKHDAATCAVCRHEAQFFDPSEVSTGWTFTDDSHRVLEFRDDGGETLNRLEAEDPEFFYAAARVGNAVYLFFTRSRFSLSAVRTDPLTGAILDRIEYF